MSIKIGSRSPWGKVNHVSEVAPGIQSCSTPGHGGFKLDRKHNEKVPAPLRQKSGWYEEDCRYAVVLVTFPEHFSQSQVRGAHKTLKAWYPDEYRAAYNVEVELKESHVLRERAAKEAARGKLQSLAAWGDWHVAVPKGKVGVVAKIDGREGSGPERYFLVPESEYDVRALVFVVDPSRHEEVARFA
jgi:hypothetical protein